jgi:hypothetical protein
MNFIDLLIQYWGVGAVAIAGVGYFITHKKVAVAYAKKTIGALMLAAEKAAEEFVLNDGLAKFTWVVEKGYDYLPSAVRMFVSKPLFAKLVQALFDEAKQIIESHKQK